MCPIWGAPGLKGRFQDKSVFFHGILEEMQLLKSLICVIFNTIFFQVWLKYIQIWNRNIKKVRRVKNKCLF